jgi:cold shock CspA family protein
MTETTKATGRIIKLSEAGWGFISSKDIKFTRIFFHWTHLRQDTLMFPELTTGMTVEFTPVSLPGKGSRAVHIRVIDKPKSHTPISDSMKEADVMTLEEAENDSMSTLPE